MNRRALLRLLSQATALALFAFGAEGCGGGSKKSDAPNNENKGNGMVDTDRLDAVRRLLDDAAQKQQSITDPLASATLGTQIAIGNAVLIIAQQVAELSGISDHTRDIASSVDSINDHTRDIASSVSSINSKT